MNSSKNSNFSTAFAEDILGWYDKHKRSLPWRLERGAENPYFTWLSEIMLQQTTVPTVMPYFLKFTGLYPRIEDLANADEDEVLREWAGLGYYARARNLIKCAKVIANDYGGRFPENFEELKKLPGIGDYTAAAISAIAFDKKANVVDGNIERIISRLFQIDEPLPKSKPLIKERAEELLEGLGERYGDYAQALMDLGATICTPRNPKCSLCPVQQYCQAYQNATMEEYPKKAPKKVKPKRYGYIYWIEDEAGKILLDKRPDKGLLGGMVGLPTTEWQQEGVAENESFNGFDFQEEKPRVKHVFTHFELELRLYRTKTTELLDFDFESRYFVESNHLNKDLGLPTVFKKAYTLLKD